jgi:hypothetical protein
MRRILFCFYIPRLWFELLDLTHSETGIPTHDLGWLLQFQFFKYKGLAHELGHREPQSIIK